MLAWCSTTQSRFCSRLSSMNTASTALTLATISRRSSWLKTGLRPFLAKLSWSEETPTTSRSPRAADRFSTRTWPTWNTSNVPKVITVLPATSTPPLRRVAPANPTVSTASHLEIASPTRRPEAQQVLEGSAGHTRRASEDRSPMIHAGGIPHQFQVQQLQTLHGIRLNVGAAQRPRWSVDGRITCDGEDQQPASGCDEAADVEDHGGAQAYRKGLRGVGLHHKIEMVTPLGRRIQ